MLRKTNISYLLMCTRTYAYQKVRSVSFSENFADVINEWPHIIYHILDLLN